MRLNPLLITDSYKLTHWKQYPPGTEHVYSYFESRGGPFPETVLFGLQYYLNEYLAGRFLIQPDIDEAERLTDLHFGRSGLFNRQGWEHILKQHDGRLPLRIKAAPEGLPVGTGNVLITVENTDPEVPWLTNYVETLLVQVWYGTTVATQSRAIRQLILGELEETGTPSLIDFKLHDFGYRGVSSIESAMVGGAAHLMNFKGSDTLAAVECARRYYQEPMAAFSIPAAEHSTITSWGADHEVDAFRNMLDRFPTGYVAVVSDSYDIRTACAKHWGETLRADVLARDGVLVVRPDSGDPARIVLSVIEILGEAFGSTMNAKGYRVLDPHVRIIQGDGVDYESIDTILRSLRRAQWSADNIAFGMGGALLQKLNRDTCRFAFKCSFVKGTYGERNVYKDPQSDHGKRSKAGRLKLVSVDGSLKTVPESDSGADLLRVVFENGRISHESTLAEIRERASLRKPVAV